MGRLLFIDSFDHYDTPHFTDKWSSGLNIGPNVAVGREAGGLDTYASPTSGRKVLQASYNELIIGFAVNFLALGVGVCAPSIGVAVNGSDIALGVGIDANGALHVYRDSTSGGDPLTSLGASASGLMVAGTYYYVEYHFNISAKTFIANVNGVQVLSLTNVGYDTARPLVNQIVASTGTNNPHAWNIDDLYVLDPTDATGYAANTFLGDVRVQYTTAAAPGRLTKFLPSPSGLANWQTVDEAPPTDDVSYVFSRNVGDTDCYGVAPIPGVAGIVGAQLVALARRDAISTRVIAVGLGNGTTEAYGPGQTPLGSYAYLLQPYDHNPLTGSPFTVVDLATLQLAVKVTA